MSRLHVWTSDRGILNLGYLNYSCNWGTHIALLYDQDSELLDLLLGVLHAGVIAKDRICCLLPASIERPLLDAYAEKYPDELDFLKEPNFLQLSQDEHTSSFFNSNDLLVVSDLIDSLYYESQIDTPKAVRFVLDIQQVLKGDVTPRELAETIFRINLAVCSKDWLQISLYDLRLIPATHLMSALEQNRFVFRKNKFVLNSLYRL
ncbi:MAG TPA: MEDS domain-containing protein [Verrucomicrobiota bacterium]|nr:MEDS domain-containing protein [Verrucomicrobiota bacterium]